MHDKNMNQKGIPNGLIKNSVKQVSVLSRNINFKNTSKYSNYASTKSIRTVPQEKLNISSTNNLLKHKYLKLGQTSHCMTSRNQYMNSTGQLSAKNSVLHNSNTQETADSGTKKPNALILKGSVSRKAFKFG